ncbi:hypothetical protein [Kitasatospora xanthocidica]|uniref:hypothetical protein n=1 Tax=Kitasatospora xanthocidica TaxID=83382 RepID=UPI00216B5255|nr:hypothetical protein [Kitasatospora xanthocidica]
MGWGLGKGGSSGGGSGANDGGQGKHAGKKDFNTTPQNQDHQSGNSTSKHGKDNDKK